MSEFNKFLDKFLEKFDFINAIIISDKEETQICGSYRGEEEVYQQASLMLSTVLSSTNENMIKLNNTKANSMTLMYTEHLVYLESWIHVKICLFCASDANLALIYAIVDDLKASLKKLNQAIESARPEWSNS